MKRLRTTLTVLIIGTCATGAQAEDNWTSAERYVQSSATIYCVNHWQARPKVSDPVKQDEIDDATEPQYLKCLAAAEGMTKEQAATVVAAQAKVSECYRQGRKSELDCNKMHDAEIALRAILGQ